MFEDLKPFKRGGTGLDGGLKLPELGGGMVASTSTPLLVEKGEKIEKEKEPSQEPDGSQDPKPTPISLPPVLGSSKSDPTPNPTPSVSHDSDAPFALDDVPILRTVTYTLKPDLFIDHPLGREARLGEYLGEISDHWKGKLNKHEYEYE